MYVSQNKLPNNKAGIRKVETSARRYILLDSVLFKLVTTPEKGTSILAILETCADKKLSLYHSCLFAEH